MAFDIRVSGEHAKVVLSGDVDLQTTADLKSEIQGVTDVTRLEIEAANVTYIDSSGVAVLLLARQHCAQNNITLSMPAVSEAVHRVLQIAKLDAMLPIGEVVAAADTGLMGLGVAEGAEAPADDDDLVNALLADDAADPGVAGSGVGDSGADLGADLGGDGAGASSFEGLDISAVDFTEPAETTADAAADADDAGADGDGANDPILPGTFS
ncbi:MAG: STAS domain-containing protein [Candidatus Puniceispirillaceae bacterium]